MLTTDRWISSVCYLKAHFRFAYLAGFFLIVTVAVAIANLVMYCLLVKSVAR